eukprot:m.118250 g.118250  ORF g.118250 m.118250 type:complete len:326 (+) comp21716_c0_seq6:734-1711(+)
MHIAGVEDQSCACSGMLISHGRHLHIFDNNVASARSVVLSTTPPTRTPQDTAMQVKDRATQLKTILDRLDTGDLPLKKEDCRNFLTRMEHDMHAMQSQLEVQESDFLGALSRYRQLQRRLIQRTSVPMQHKSEEYRNALEAQPSALIEELMQAVEFHTNTSVLAPGTIVEVIQNGRVVPAIVKERAANDAYLVLVETEGLIIKQEYTKSFATPAVVPRSQLYAREIPLRQPPPGHIASGLAVDQHRDAMDAEVTTTDPEYLSELLVVAESLRPRFLQRIQDALAVSNVGSVVEVCGGPLKKAGRITQRLQASTVATTARFSTLSG